MKGFSLFEVLIAMLIFSMGFLASADVLGHSAKRSIQRHHEAKKLVSGFSAY